MIAGISVMAQSAQSSCPLSQEMNAPRTPRRECFLPALWIISPSISIREDMLERHIERACFTIDSKLRKSIQKLCVYVLLRYEDSISYPGNGFTDCCEMSRELWELNPGLLEEQSVLLIAETSPQPPA
ncbi:rCG29021 [Rattus norvegicus]|uniref:RCG29021 n=1 Tax=Rattus norvegicus TaxID=10116 RepID=A6HVC1_RAT|nr:rCG29021 [Rattus norvegicus]